MSNQQHKLYLAVEQLVNQKIGLDLSAVSGINLANIVQRITGISEPQSLDAYYEKLLADPKAFTELIEFLVIPETSFFRHSAAFDFLQTYCLNQKYGKTLCRILSVPCSTGEEPYSIAISLLEAGFLPSQIQVDAFDISPEAIKHAQAGLYKKYAFRSANTNQTQYYLQKYFTQEGNLYRIKSSIKDIVNFQVGNLVDPQFLAFSHLYDAIFCRNVLIYFTQDARHTVLRKLHQLLVDQGLLFLGYAETNFIDNSYFTTLSIPHAFVYEKKDYSLRLKQTLHQKLLPPSLLQKSPNQFPQIPQIKKSRPKYYSPIPNSLTTRSRQLMFSLQKKSEHQNAPKPKTKNPTVDHKLHLYQELINIRVLADQNQLDFALEKCQKFIQKNQTDDQAYLLLGEIYQAKNQDSLAEAAYKKALYLNPKSEEAIIHLIFLSEQMNKEKQTERYRERLKSITKSAEE